MYIWIEELLRISFALDQFECFVHMTAYTLSTDWKIHIVCSRRGLCDGYPDKIPRKKSPQKIPLNAVEQEPVPTRVLNPNAKETSYKPKQSSFFIFIFFSGGFWSGRFYPRTTRRNHVIASFSVINFFK